MKYYHGYVGEFNPNQKDWAFYTERLVRYFVANSVTEEAADRQRAILWCSYISIDQESGSSWQANGQKFFRSCDGISKDHHQPRPSTVLQRFNLHMRTQKPGE